jgi:hypothetical protein
MKTLFQMTLLLCLVSTVTAQEKLGDYDWNELAQRHALLGGEVVSLDGGSVLKIVNTNDSALQLPLFKILKPSISNMVYALTGQVKYENVEGDAYLEMWNYFPPGQPGLPEGAYFSRTLGTSGEMGKITATSDWRNYSLPFNRTGTFGLPTRLEINIFLPGHGTVYLRSAQLLEYGDTRALNDDTESTGWWSAEAAPWIGGIGGPLIGCSGGLLGWLAGKGKARRFVLAAWKGCIAVGILFLVAAIIAFATGQPSYVSMPLFIFGIVPTVVFSAVWPSAKKSYADLEIRRMAAIDSMRS